MRREPRITPIVPAGLAVPRRCTAADLHIDTSRFHQQFAADVPEATPAVMAATQGPVADAALTEGASVPAWRDIPSWVLVAAEDRDIPAQVQISRAGRAQATVVTVGASHTLAVSRPGDVARLIDEAVRATC
ncbi:alpha/beta fold hydrolase [Streptomyces aquilus]|uniref:alpha/beta fold hydrolase n=1 Tax=Streptomyces aquilus TaxID=2548456 RepID=UPI0036A6AE36